jgi:ribosome-associated protein
MDYVDFIVHVFSAEKRAFYGLERLRKSATTISVADLNAELSARITETRAKAPKKVATAKPTGKKSTTAHKPSVARKSVSTKAVSKTGSTKKPVAKNAKKAPAKTPLKAAKKKKVSTK